MNVRIEFNTDNDAFSNCAMDESRNVILQAMQAMINQFGYSGFDLNEFSYALHDSNGNRVGQVTISE